MCTLRRFMTLRESIMQKDLTKGSILKNLIYFSLPYLLSCFLQTFYGLADLFITGQFNGAATISAVANGSQIMHMITVIIVGLAMGSTVMISQAIGGNHPDRAAKSIGNTITLFMAVSVILTAILLIFTNSIISVISVPKEAVPQTRLYLMICFAGIPFITAYNIISCVFRGMGDSKSPMYFIAVACVVNIALDYLFIGCLDMGASGAALGTVSSQIISVIVAGATVSKKKPGILLKKQDLIPDKNTMGNIIKIGIPISLQDGFIQVSFIIITIIANNRGVTIAASVGIVEKIIGFLFLIPSAMLSAVSAISAQNIGAGKDDRARRTLKYGIIISTAFGLFFSILCQFISSPLIGMFSDDAEVIRMGSQYLRSYVFDCVLAGIHFCFSGFFCAYGLSLISFIHNLISIVLVRIPGAYLASKYFPNSLFEMGMAAPLGSLLSALICSYIYIYLNSRKNNARQ